MMHSDELNISLKKKSWK